MLSIKYKKIIVTARGGPDVLQVIEDELQSPEVGKARIKILATPVCAPDVTTRYGKSPFTPNLPYSPGYAFIGAVEAIGEDVKNVRVGDRVAALTAYGSYAEYIEWEAEDLIPVPVSVDPINAVPLILNYIVAYHVMHRWAKVKAGDRVLIIGASGGIGTALLQLGQLAGLNMYGLASPSKHAILTEYGATAIDYHTQDFVEVIRQAEPMGMDAVFDGMAGDYLVKGLSMLGKGGTLIGYGNPLSVASMLKSLGQVALFNLIPNGKSAKYYSTGVSRFNRAIFLEDWAKLFELLDKKEIEPIIAAKFPILEAAKANQFLESGQVIGNVVLGAPEIL